MYLKQHRQNFSRILAAAICLITCACSMLGGAPDLERASGYQVEAPSEWSRRSRGDSDKAYSLPTGNVVTVVSSCHRNSTAPLDVLTRHLLMGTRDVQVKKRQKLKLGPNEGLNSRIVAKMEGQPIHLELFVLAKNDCVFDFSLVSPQEIPEGDSKAFHQFIASFRYGKD